MTDLHRLPSEDAAVAAAMRQAAAPQGRPDEC
jgi:hypothetical protein